MKNKCSSTKRVLVWWLIILQCVWMLTPSDVFALSCSDLGRPEDGGFSCTDGENGVSVTTLRAVNLDLGNFDSVAGSLNVFDLSLGNFTANVIGSNPTLIGGKFEIKNGIMSIFNARGVHVLSTADFKFENGSLLAAAGNMNKITGKIDATGFVLNEGKFHGTGDVAFVGKAVENKGTINLPLNRVFLGAGKAVTVGLSGDNLVSVVVAEGDELGAGEEVFDFEGKKVKNQIENSGKITGHKITLNAKGVDSVFEKAINLKSEIKAVDVDTNDRGEIVMLSMDDIYSKAILEASKLEFSTADHKVDLSGSLKVYDFKINKKTTVNGGDAKIKVSKDWQNDGVFNGEQSEVEFKDANQVSTVTGNNTFHNFTVKTPKKEIHFEAGKTQTITGALTVQGAYAEHVKLLSTVDGVEWKINPLGAIDIQYGWVKDSHNLNGTKIIMRHSTNRGNSIDRDPTGHWVGPAFGLWSDGNNWADMDGGTGGTAFGGADPGGGDDLIFNLNSYSYGDSLYGGGTFNSLTLTGTSTNTTVHLLSELTVANLNIFGQTLSIDGQSLTVTNLLNNQGTIKLFGDENLSVGDFSQGSGKWYYMGTGFGRDVELKGLYSNTANAYRNYYDLEITNGSYPQQNYNLFSNNLHVDGRFDLTGGKLYGSSSQLTVQGLTTVGGQYLVSGSSTFNGGLTIAGGYFNGTNTVLDINGDFNVSSGTFIAPSTAYTVSGNMGVGDSVTFTKNAAGIIFDGTTASTYDDSSYFNKKNIGKVTVAKTGSASNNKLTLQQGMTVDTMTVNANNTLVLGPSSGSGNTNILKLANVGAIADVLTVNGTMVSGTSLGVTVQYAATNSAGNINIANLSYNSLRMSGAETYDLSASLTGANKIKGTVTIDSGATLDSTLSNRDLEVQGDFFNAGTFRARNGTVTFSKTSGIQNLNSGGTTFNNISHTGAGTLELSTGNNYTVASNLSVGGTFINSAGTFDPSSRDVTVTGLTTVTGGSYRALSQRQTFNGGLTVSGGTYDAAWVGTTDVNGNVTIGANGTFKGDFARITVSGDWNNMGGEFIAGKSHVLLDGAGVQNLTGGGDSFWDLTHFGAGQVQLQDDIAVANSFSNARGLFYSNNHTITLPAVEKKPTRRVINPVANGNVPVTPPVGGRDPFGRNFENKDRGDPFKRLKISAQMRLDNIKLAFGRNRNIADFSKIVFKKQSLNAGRTDFDLRAADLGLNSGIEDFQKMIFSAQSKSLGERKENEIKKTGTSFSNIIGPVKVVAEDGTIYDAKEGLSLQKGDQVWTGAGAKVELAMTDGKNIVTVKENSAVSIHKNTSFQTAAPEDLLKIAFGKVSVVVSADDSSSSFVVQVPNGMAGLRG